MRCFGADMEVWESEDRTGRRLSWAWHNGWRKRGGERMTWRWKPFYVLFANAIENIVDYYKLPRNGFTDFVQGWAGTIPLYLDKEAMESLKQAMEDAKHGRFSSLPEYGGSS